MMLPCLQSIGLDLGTDILSGAVTVEHVYALSPAESFGLQTGDILISIDGERLLSARQALHLLAQRLRQIKRSSAWLVVERPRTPSITPDWRSQSYLAEVELDVKLIDGALDRKAMGLTNPRASQALSPRASAPRNTHHGFESRCSSSHI